MTPATKLSILLLFIASLMLTQPPESSVMAEKTIKVRLTSSTTNGAGKYGQPVVNYHAPVSFGTPEKLFNIQFDVGLNDIFVPHYEWSPLKTNLHYRNGYQCKMSSTCERGNGSETSIFYNNCNLKGKIYDDVLSLKNSFGSQVSPTVRQKFLAAADASETQFKELPVDGYIGLGPVPHSGLSLQNFLITLQSANLVDKLQFSLWLNPSADSQPGGELVLGGLDSARYQGKIYWHSSSPRSAHWTFDLQHVSLGAEIVSCKGRQCEVTLSSALNEVFGPRDEVERIYKLLNTTNKGKGIEVVDCNQVASLPALSFTIDGVSYPLEAKNYIRKTKIGTIFKDEVCFVAILPSDDNRKWTLGTSFLSAYYSVYDVTNHQVGFAGLK